MPTFLSFKSNNAKSDTFLLDVEQIETSNIAFAPLTVISKEFPCISIQDAPV